MSDRRLTALTAAAVLAVLAGVFVVPWLVRDRTFAASVPQAQPLVSTAVVPVRSGARACLAPVPMLARSRVADVRVGTRAKPAVPLTITAEAPGYRAAARVAPSYQDNDTVAAALAPPRADTAARVCVRNDGPRTIDLYASDDRARVPFERTTVDGRPRAANFMLRFTEARPHSIVSRLPVVVRAVGAFRGPLAGGWLVWPLLVLVIAGTPTAIALAIWWSIAPDAPLSSPAVPHPEPEPLVQVGQPEA